MDNHIQTLVEMGFSHDQAVQALASSGNDLTKAIGYLFGEVDDKGAGTQASPYIVDTVPVDSFDSVNVSNPQDLPEFLVQYSNEALETVAPALPTMHSTDMEIDSSNFSQSVHAEQISESPGNYNYGAYPDSSQYDDRRDQDSLDSLDNQDGQDARQRDEYMEDADRAPNIKTGQLFPSVVVTGMRARLWVPILAILARFTPFADAVLANEDPSPFTAEVQRIVYFVRNFRRSKRWYVSADRLVAMLPADLADDYMEDEAVLGAYEHLMAEEPSTRPILESFVENVEEEISKDLAVLEIDSDTRRNTLYATLNELFWQKGFVKLGVIKYKTVAPVVTYQLLGDAAGYSVMFELQETVYPEVYSDKALAAVEREVNKMRDADSELQATTRTLMDLNFFEGKKITGLLRQAVEALAGDDDLDGKKEKRETPKAPETEKPGATSVPVTESEGSVIKDNVAQDAPFETDLARISPSADLQQLMGQIDAARTHHVAEQTRLRLLAQGGALTSYDDIAAKCSLTPYDLLGVVFNESRYYVRLDTDTYVLGDGIVMDFDDVQLAVALETRRGSHLVTVIYGVRSGCPTEDDEEEEENEEEGGENKEKEAVGGSGESTIDSKIGTLDAGVGSLDHVGGHSTIGEMHKDASVHNISIVPGSKPEEGLGYADTKTSIPPCVDLTNSTNAKNSDSSVALAPNSTQQSKRDAVLAGENGSYAGEFDRSALENNGPLVAPCVLRQFYADEAL